MKILSLITLGNGVKMTFEVKHTDDSANTMSSSRNERKSTTTPPFIPIFIPNNLELSSSLFSQASLADPLPNSSSEHLRCSRLEPSVPTGGLRSEHPFGCSTLNSEDVLRPPTGVKRAEPLWSEKLRFSSGSERFLDSFPRIGKADSETNELVVGGVNAPLPSWAPQGTVEPIPIFIPEPHKKNRLWFEMDEPADKEMMVTVYEVPKDAPIFIDTSKGKEYTFHQSGLRYPHMLLPGTYIFTFSNDQYTQLSVVFENNKLSIGEY